MSIDREIQRLRLRIKQLGKQINPPTLRCIVVDQNKAEGLPLSEEVGIYDLVINIEPKPEWAFKKGY